MQTHLGTGMAIAMLDRCLLRRMTWDNTTDSSISGQAKAITIAIWPVLLNISKAQSSV